MSRRGRRVDALHERSCCLCAELLPGQRSGSGARRRSAQNLPGGLHQGKRDQPLFMGGNSAMLTAPVK